MKLLLLQNVASGCSTVGVCVREIPMSRFLSRLQGTQDQGSATAALPKIHSALCAGWPQAGSAARPGLGGAAGTGMQGELPGLTTRDCGWTSTIL